MDTFNTLDDIGRLIHHEHSKPMGFRDEERSLEREMMLICSEIFEAFEDVRNGKEKSDKIPDFTPLEEEWADAVIRLLESAYARGLRLGDAVRAKHTYNMTRPHKHGKAF